MARMTVKGVKVVNNNPIDIGVGLLLNLIESFIADYTERFLAWVWDQVLKCLVWLYWARISRLNRLSAIRKREYDLRIARIKSRRRYLERLRKMKVRR